MALLSAAAAFTSCSGFLDEEPKLKQSNELTFSNYDGLDAACAALYGMMQSASWYDGVFILQSELRAGNAKNPISIPGSGRYRNDTQWNTTRAAQVRFGPMLIIPLHVPATSSTILRQPTKAQQQTRI